MTSMALHPLASPRVVGSEGCWATRGGHSLRQGHLGRDAEGGAERNICQAGQWPWLRVDRDTGPTWAPAPCRMVAMYRRVGLGCYSPSLRPLPCPVCVGCHGSHCPQKFFCVELAGRAGGISGCPADGRLLPEQQGLCPPDSPPTPSLLLDPTPFSLLCCPFFSLVLRTPNTMRSK